MKRALIGFAALSLLAGPAFAAVGLNNTQLDSVAAGADPTPPAGLDCGSACQFSSSSSSSTNGVTTTVNIGGLLGGAGGNNGGSGGSGNNGGSGSGNNGGGPTNTGLAGQTVAVPPAAAAVLASIYVGPIVQAPH